MVKLFKLNFEKTVILVLVMILLISSTSIYTQFFDLIFKEKAINTVQTGSVKDLSFPIILLKADQLYKEERYKEAQTEYLTLTNMPTLSSQQKAVAYFKLGLCNYKLQLYDLAFDSFIKSTNFNTGDEVAYNNAAVCSFLAGDMEKAETYQKKALSILPAVEFYYNLGRIYEKTKRYEEAAKYYIPAINRQENISRNNAIDPVLLSVKVNKLFPDKAARDEASKEFLMALKLKDARDVFIIEDEYMNVDANFNTRFINTEEGSKLSIKYDRQSNDPYHLIESLKWTVRRGNRVLYESKRDEFTLKIQEEDDYEVQLSINYSGKVKAKSKLISRNQIKDVLARNRVQSDRTAEETCKYYVAVYEQVFGKEFKLSSKGYTDRFKVEWGKDNVETVIMDQDFMDAGNSLDILNTSKRDAGIWADLSALLESKNLKGKTINVAFYARKITYNARLNARLRVKADQIYYDSNSFKLDYKWRQYNMKLFIPQDSTSLTFSLGIKPDEEVKIDGFIVTMARQQ